MPRQKRELSDAALEMIAEEVLRPRLAYVGEMVSEILGRDAGDELVTRCVLSIQAQCHAAMRGPLAKQLIPDLSVDQAALDRLADHIADFSLGGLRNIARSAG